MQCIVYVSSAKEAFNERDLHHLAERASENNRSQDVTGYLFFQKNTFVQYLEGAGSAVQGLMSKIATDERHQVVFQVDGTPLATRRFPNWAMRYLTSKEMHEINFEKMLADELNLANAIGEMDQMSEKRVWRLVDLIANSRLNQF